MVSSDQQLKQFEEQGAVLLDTPFTTDQLDRAEAAVMRRDQALVWSGTMLHSAWYNEDTVPRKALLTGWRADGVRVGVPAHHYEGAKKHHPKIHRRLRPDRAHLVPEDPHFFFEIPYSDKWSEMFHPDHREE